MDPTPRTIIRRVAAGEDVEATPAAAPRTLEDPTPRGLIRALARDGPPSTILQRGRKQTPRGLIRLAAAEATPAGREVQEDAFTPAPVKRARVEEQTPEIDWDARAYSPEAPEDSVLDVTNLVEETEAELRSPYRPVAPLSPQQVTAELPFIAPTISISHGRRGRPKGKGRPPLAPAEEVIGGERQKADTNKDVEATSDDQIPPHILQRLFSTFSNVPLGPGALTSLGAATDAYLKQISGDLVAYGTHAHRVTIEKDDVSCLFRRQRLVHGNQSVDDVVRREMPLEIVEELLPVARAGNVVVPR